MYKFKLLYFRIPLTLSSNFNTKSVIIYTISDKYDQHRIYHKTIFQLKMCYL